MNPVFAQIGKAHAGRSVFDLSYEKKLTCDMGKLIPIMVDDYMPGDVVTIGNQITMRFQPLVAPIMHEVNLYVHYFFVPYRLLWPEPNGWESFITGGPNGDLAPTLPTWNPVSTAVGSLWDYCGMPTGVTPTGFLPVDFPKRAYNQIYNDYYMDLNLWAKVDITTSDAIKYRCWEKDYFTSALPWTQRGVAPGVPIGNTSAVWQASTFPGDQTGQAMKADVRTPAGTYPYIHTYQAEGQTNTLAAFNANLVASGSFTINELRLTFATQRWLERQARGGSRYVETLMAHFGVSPRDYRLQRAEYIGGSKQPIVISEVLQTSRTDAGQTPQGTMAGHGLSHDAHFCGKYRVEEFGCIMGIMSIMPRSAYQQGVPRQWIKTTKLDYVWPEFVHLGEQAIKRGEIYADGNSTNNNTVFGYQGRYDEYRTKQNMVSGDMRSTFTYWHMGRIFSGAPALNQSFIECQVALDKRNFAVQTVDTCLVNVGNLIKCVRPIPAISEPGLIDH